MDIFEQLEAVFSERRSEAFRHSKKYRKYALKEEELINKLKGSLTDDQQAQLAEYIAAKTDTEAVMESLSYRQGMADLLAFLKCIEYREEG